MTQHLLGRDVAVVRILSRDEAKQNDMRIEFGDPRVEFFLGDVRDPDTVRRAVDGAQLVFHAAALKQVPSCEFFPIEAVKTNVLGSSNVIDAAYEFGAESVVFLSTDKAVFPINAMGMTKGLMEKVAQSAARTRNGSGTVVSTVRYGNVMYSRGSVIPLFVDQLFAGKPITLTDPTMTRFLLSLSSAVELVEYAFANAAPGDVFIRKAPAATLQTLADALLQSFGVRDHPIEMIGVRHGEKIFETLATSQELRSASDEGDFWRLQMDSKGLDYRSYYSSGQTEPDAIDDFHSHNARRLTVDETAELLLELPEIRAAIERWATRS